MNTIIFFGYMLINPTRDVVVSLACFSYSESVRLGLRFNSVENVTPRIFLKFLELKYERTFSLLYHDAHGA